MTDAPQLYLRRCNGHPDEGKPTSRACVEYELAHAIPGVTALAIDGDLETGLSIRIPAGRPWEVETPGTVERTFTYEPVPTGQRRAPAANTNSSAATATKSGPPRAMMEGEA